MGYSISQEQHERLERNRRAGRLCAMSTGRGGCFTAATTAHLTESWPYAIGEGRSRLHTQHFCGRHSSVCAVGVNFRTLDRAPLPVKRCPCCSGTDTEAISYADFTYDSDDGIGTPDLVVYGYCRECGERY